MFIALCSLVLVSIFWGLRQHRQTLRAAACRNQGQAMRELDGLLRDLEARGRAPRQELAAVRGRTAVREHVWCAPGGEEVFLN